MADDPEMWASILGWQCWRDAAGTWHARRAGPTAVAVLHAASLGALRASIDRAGHPDPGPAGPGSASRRSRTGRG